MRESAWYASVGGGVLALGIGTSLVTASVVGVVQDRDRYRAEAARPRPARTVTVTAPPIAAPSPEPSVGATKTLMASGPVTAVSTTADRPVAAQQTSPGRIRPPQSPVPGGSSSAPGTGPTSPSGCEGAVSARLRLGVLPRCAITIQGR